LVSHGAATLTVRDDDPTGLALRRAGGLLQGSRAVVILSAHDARGALTVGSAARVPLYADHPAAAGRSWVAPGDEQLADALLGRLTGEGLTAQKGQPRLDHGAWVPLMALDPSGSRPVVTLSLDPGLDPERHLRIGRAVAALRREGVGVITSGGLTHNQAEFRRRWFAGAPVEATTPASARFEAWALEVLAEPGEARTRALLAAPQHPDFGWCHPTLDHWLPTLVAVGAAEGAPGTVLHRGFQHALSTALLAFGA
jgi:4,5-DOPA dioxygenase extradiol